MEGSGHGLIKVLSQKEGLRETTKKFVKIACLQAEI
jgi:hypothetical protein